MKILSFTAGAANMYCGSCLGDNALARELKRQGHDIVLMPLYTPTRTDEPNVSRPRVLLGGISVYLQQRTALFRRTPRLLDKVLDAPAVIRAFAGRGVETDPALLGELTVATLQGSRGPLAKEFRKLAAWLKSEPPPDVVSLPNSMLIALARRVRRVTGRPVVCWLQGEELFLQNLPEPWQSKALDLIRAQVHEVDAFLAVSDSTARFMGGWLGIPPDKMHVVPLGINADGFEAANPGEPGPVRIGFLARIAPEKGLHLLCEAYRILRQRGSLPPSRLEAAGYLAPEHAAYLAGIQESMRDWGLETEFRYHGELSREEKIRFLQSLDVFSLPCTYDEPKGLPVLEAMACGVPVVQPRWGAFPEILDQTGGGLLVATGSAEALAEGLLAVVREPRLAARLGRQGYQGVRRHRTVAHMARRTLEVYEGLLAGSLEAPALP